MRRVCNNCIPSSSSMPSTKYSLSVHLCLSKQEASRFTGSSSSSFGAIFLSLLPPTAKCITLNRIHARLLQCGRGSNFNGAKAPTLWLVLPNQPTRNTERDSNRRQCGVSRIGATVFNAVLVAVILLLSA